MEILNWFINPELKKETEEHYRTQLAIGLKDSEPLTIIRQITFDGVAPSIEIRDIENLFDFVEIKFLKGKIKGIGVEVGSGPGTFSSVLAKRNSVQKIYAVEVCQPIVELLTPKVSDYILNGKKDKVVGIVGSFDNMELTDESVDFVFDFLSLHHSNDLVITLKECHRILKRGGFVLCFDKARPDYFTQKDLDELLDSEYGAKDKILFGLSPEEKFTRRMNSEKEYRLKDWISAFRKSGFSKIENFYLAKTSSGNKLVGFIKDFLGSLPLFCQRLLMPFLPKSKFSHKFILDDSNKVFSRTINPFSKEISLIVAYK